MLVRIRILSPKARDPPHSNTARNSASKPDPYMVTVMDWGAVEFCGSCACSMRVPVLFKDVLDSQRIDLTPVVNPVEELSVFRGALLAVAGGFVGCAAPVQAQTPLYGLVVAALS